MNKAFIFDMDGVIIDSEAIWHSYESDFLKKAFGNKIANQIGDYIGISVKSIFERAKNFGATISYAQLQQMYDETAIKVYKKANISPGIDEFAEFLLSQDFKIGIVSSSSLNWINMVTPRLRFNHRISNILSLNERSDLAHKPNPDGFIEMMRILNVSPKNTIVLEDSNAGIKAALDSHAYTVAYAQNLVSGYKQIPANAKAKTMSQVMNITKTRFGLG